MPFPGGGGGGGLRYLGCEGVCAALKGMVFARTS